MMLKRLLLCLAIVLAPALVHAQAVSRSSQEALNNQYFIGCGTGCITGPIINNYFGTLNNSVGFLTDTNVWTGANNFTGSTPTINGVPIRVPVNAAQSYYVNPSSSSTAACGPAGVSTCQPGSNTTGNGTVAAPWQTVAFAVSAVQNGYDFKGNAPTIYLAHGTDTGNVQCHNNGANVGRVVIFIQGDTSSPTSTVIQSPNGGEGIFVKDYCALSLQSLTIADQGSALTGVHVGQVGIVDFNNVHFTAFSATGVFIHEEQGASASITQAPIYLDGGGKNWLKIESGAVFYASDGVPLTGEHIEIDSAVAFTKGLAAIGPASLVGFSASTFTGTGVAGTTGIRAALVGPVYLQGNAAACASIFPGNSACTLTQGAGDDGLDTLTTQLPVASGGTGTGTAGATAVANISGATPVSCPSGVTAATVVVVNGIITHC